MRVFGGLPESILENQHAVFVEQLKELMHDIHLCVRLLLLLQVKSASRINNRFSATMCQQFLAMVSCKNPFCIVGNMEQPLQL